jgi:putative effector of murein hydrolase LrgA (UPF0299 family)
LCEVVANGDAVLVIPVDTFLCFELVAASLLALWLVARFPRLGPKALRPALAVCIGALAVFQFVPVGVVALAHLPHGAYVALFGCTLPGYFFVFLAAAWLMRSLAGALGGSGGGPGHHVPVDARS